MSEHAVYELAVTTHRPAELLAQMHGFEGVTQLANELPPDAQVLDVGAGASPFGREVAALRPDITWVNVDYSYHDTAILEEARTGAPPNLDCVAGDATSLDTCYPPGVFDAVFSYWLLPHLSLDDPAPAHVAAAALFALTKPYGLISVGPRMAPGRLSFRGAAAMQVVKTDDLTSGAYADRIVAETRLPDGARELQKLANEVATPFFGTSRYTKRDGRIPKLYHPQSGEYVSALSPKAFKTTGRLLLATARHAAGQRAD